VVEATAFRPCRSLGAPRGDLRPIDCRPRLGETRFRELLTLSEPGASAGPEDRALAAAGAVALSPDLRTIERALARLASAAPPEPGSASLLLARGALEHARARATGDPALLVDALEATDRALEAAPESRAALFNRAVIEGDLGLCRRARESWHAYFDVDRDSGWADEGRVRSGSLPCRERGPAPAALGAASSSPRERDRLFERTLEDLLPVWLDAQESGAGQGASLLREMSRIAARIETDAGDPWLAELVAELRRDGGDPEYRGAIGRYVRGRRLFQQEDYQGSRRLLVAARQVFEARDSALLPWCDLWLAGIDVYRGRFPQAGDRLGRLARAPRVVRSPMLSGKVAWARGLRAIRAGRLQDAYDRYSEAARAFERGGFLVSSASIHMLKGEALADLGFVENSWRDRAAALRALQGPDPQFMLRNALLDGATVAARQGAFRVATTLLDEVQAIAEEGNDRATSTETLLFRGETLLDAGATAEAAATFARALDAAERLSPGLVRQRFEAYSRVGLWATGRPVGDGDLADLDGAIRFFADKGPQSLQLWALRVKARVAAQAGREDLARSIVTQAVGQIRRTVSELRDESFELRYWEMAQAVFDEAIGRAAGSGAPAEALGYLEEARALTEGPRQALPFDRCSVAEAGTRYPSRDGVDAVVLAFGVVDDEVLWWRVDGDRCLFGRTDARRARSAAQSLRASSRAGNVDPADLERWYEELLANPLRGVPANVTLRIVPDRFLLTVPFAALRNPATGKRLVEERAISFHQDLDAALRAGGGASAAAPRRTWRVLAVGDPAFDRSALPWLARLPGARLEAERVAGSYPGGSKLLLGQDATLARVDADLAGRQVLHLAVHALTSPGDSNDGLVLAREPAAAGSSGLSPVRDLLPALPRGLELVVLSGCSTLGTTPTRSSGLSGLSRPFIARGVPAVVGTLWPVSDDLLRDLMIRFHAGILQGAAASEALRDAQLAELARSPEGSGFDWSAVQLYGELPAANDVNDGKE